MIEIPARMRHLRVDRRGYPIPWGVYLDPNGKPHFAINNDERRVQMLTRDLCSICGTKLFRGRWFVGGPLSAFHEQGLYLDPPMHHECASFALQVCPYLALPKYAREVGAKTLTKTDVEVTVLDRYGTTVETSRPKEQGPWRQTILIDDTMIPERPPLFVAVMATGQVVVPSGLQIYVKPKRPYKNVEYWCQGQLLPTETGKLAVQVALELQRKEESDAPNL